MTDNKLTEALREAVRQLKLIGTPDDAINNSVVSVVKAAVPLAEAVPGVVEALRLILKKCPWAKREQWCGTIGCNCNIARDGLAAYDAADK